MGQFRQQWVAPATIGSALQPAIFPGKAASFHSVGGADLGGRLRQIVPHRSRRERECAANLLVGATLVGEPKNGALAVAQRVGGRERRRGGELWVDHAGTARDAANGVGQLVGGAGSCRTPWMSSSRRLQRPAARPSGSCSGVNPDSLPVRWSFLIMTSMPVSI